MVHEPLTFDPAAREIAHEISRLAARIRARLATHAPARAHLHDA